MPLYATYVYIMLAHYEFNKHNQYVQNKINYIISYYLYHQ